MNIRKKALFGGLFLFILFNLGCAGPPPIKDYVLAYTAKDYAKKYQAHKYANKLYYKGNQHFKKALYYYNKREHTKAQENFVLARRYLEKAEVKARLKILDGGGEDFL